MNNNKYKIIVSEERKIYLMSDEQKGSKKEVERRVQNIIGFVIDSVDLIENDRKIFDFKEVVPSWCKFVWSTCAFGYDLGKVTLPEKDWVEEKTSRKDSRFRPLILLHEIGHALEDDCNGNPCNRAAPSRKTLERCDFETKAWFKAFKMLLEGKAKPIQQIMCYGPVELAKHASRSVASYALEEQKEEVRQKYLEIFKEWFS